MIDSLVEEAGCKPIPLRFEESLHLAGGAGAGGRQVCAALPGVACGGQRVCCFAR